MYGEPARAMIYNGYVLEFLGVWASCFVTGLSVALFCDEGRSDKAGSSKVLLFLFRGHSGLAAVASLKHQPLNSCAPFK